MAEIIKATIQLRRATEDEWNKIGSSFIPKEGEPCLTLDGENAGKVKYGDGINTWNNLLYSNINSNGADWNQNNSNGPGYIKNRTHYSYMVMEEKYNGFEYTEADANSGKQIDVPLDFSPFQVGDTVKVIINDVEYSCVAQNAFDLGALPDELPPESSYVVIADHPLTSVDDKPEWIFEHIIARDNACYFFSDSPATISWSTGNINYTQDDLAKGMILPDFPPFQAGDTVKVTINDVEHTCIAQNMFDLGLPSDDYLPGSQMNIITENPVTSIDELSGWYIWYSDVIIGDQCTFYSKSAAVVSYPTGEYEEKEMVKKLPSKYLDPPDWEQNDENGPGYIKNRPFYKLVAEDVIIFETETGAPTSGQGSVKICDLPGDLIPGRTYTIESSEGIEEIECVLLTDAETVPWYGELGYPILLHNLDGGGIAQLGGYVANGEEALLQSETWWSKDGPLKITGPLDFSKKLNSDLMNAPVNSVNNKTGNVYLYGYDIIENARAINLRTGDAIWVNLPYDDIMAQTASRLVICSLNSDSKILDDDESVVSLGGGYFILCAALDNKKRIFFGKNGSTGTSYGYTTIELSGLDDPTLQSSATTKHYVDTEIAKILPSIDGVPDGYVLGISEGKIAWVPKN